MININGIEYDLSNTEPEDWASFTGDGKTQAQVKREAFALYREAKRIEAHMPNPIAVTVEKTNKEKEDEKLEIAERRLKSIEKYKEAKEREKERKEGR